MDRDAGEGGGGGGGREGKRLAVRECVREGEMVGRKEKRAT